MERPILSEEELSGANFYKNLKENYDACIFFWKCKYCGKLIVILDYEDNEDIGTPYGRTRRYGRRFLSGGRSKNGFILCDRCLNTGEITDTVVRLRIKKEKLEKEIKQLFEKMKEIMETIYK